VRKGLVEAADVKDARERLAADGVLAERVSPSGRRLRFPAETRAVVYRELSELLAAGLPLVKALDTLIESPELRGAGVLLAGVRDRIREGASLADAFCEAGSSVTPFEKAVIEAAEQTATVEVMLERLATFIEEQETLKQSVHSALVYPAIVVAMAVCVAVVMLGLLLPRAQDLLAGNQVGLPALTRWTIRIGRAAVRWGAPLLLLLGGALLWVRRRLRWDREWHARWDRGLFRLPLVGKGYRLLVNMRFSRTLAMLLNGGVGIIDGLVLAGRATGSAWVTALSEAQAEAVRNGASLSNAVAGIPPLSASLPGWIRVGEASGGLERLLVHAGRRYEQHWDRFMKRGLSLLEPVLILVIGAFVLLVTLSVLLPVFTLIRALG
jgi:general secretion pathway protein F